MEAGLGSLPIATRAWAKALRLVERLVQSLAASGVERADRLDPRGAIARS